ncbi:carbohydrate ABC transporter permease [Pseudolactococcus yaeyamensis]
MTVRLNKILIFFVLLLTLYPICFVFLGSFMGNEEVKQYLAILNAKDSQHYVSVYFAPKFPTLRAYVALLLDTPEFFVAFWNSVKVVSLILVGQLAINLPATWWFIRIKWRGKDWLYRLYIVLMVLPFVVMMLPQYMIFKQFNLLDKLAVLILPAIFSTFSVFIIYPYFRAIPQELIESAQIDGATEWQIFYKIGLPLAMPGMIISVVLNLIEYWGSVEQTLAFVKDKTLWTIPLFVSSIQTSKPVLAFVSAVVAMILPLLVMLIFRQDLTNGLLNNAGEKQ